MVLRARAARLIVLLFVVLSIGGLGGFGCKKKSAEGGSGAAALSPIPPPPGLLAEIVAPTPDATWGKARAIVGGTGGALLPQSFGALVTNMLGLPIAAAAEIDGNVPVVGAVGDQASGPPRIAVAVHVKEGARFADQLTKGEGAKFTAHPDAASQINVLEPAAQAPSPYALGVLGNYLLIAPTRDEMIALGPYAARTLAVAPPPKEDLVIEMPEAALAGPVQAIAKRALDSFAAMRAQGEPVGSDVAVPAVTEGLAILGDCTRARLAVTMDAAAVHANMILHPKPGNGPASASLASLAVGDPRRMLELPSDVLFAATWYDSHALRAEKSASYVDALEQALGVKLSQAERDALTEALRAFAQARGDWAVAGLSIGATGIAAYLREAVASPDDARKALKAIEAAVDTPSVKGRVKQAGYTVATSAAKVDGISGDARRVHIERVAKTGALPTSPFDAMLQNVDILVAIDRELVATAGADPRSAMTQLLGAPAAKSNFGSTPEVRAALDALGTDVSAALVVDPMKLLALRNGTMAEAAAPVVLAFGKHAALPPAPSGELWARVDVANIAIREIASKMGK